MRIITHQHHIDALPETNVKTHIQKRFDQLYETDEDLLPNLILVEAGDDITGPDYAFVGNRGLLSDLFQENKPGHLEFVRPYEWASYLPQLGLYEVLLLINNEDGYWILIPEATAEANPDLYLVLTNESQGGLSDPQPLH
jgi:hypothetical protein